MTFVTISFRITENGADGVGAELDEVGLIVEVVANEGVEVAEANSDGDLVDAVIS